MRYKPLLLLLLLSSCALETIPDRGITEIMATRDNGTSQKTILSNDRPEWVEGDEMCVMNSSEAIKYTAGASGAEVSFTGRKIQDDGTLLALSPYSSCNGRDGKVLKFSVPSVQTGSPGTFDPEAFVCAGKVMTGSSPSTVTMKNVCSLVEVVLKSSDITRIKFFANGKEPICGTAEVSIDNIDSLSFQSGCSPCAELQPRVGLTCFTPGTYYICILPATLSEGFTLYFETETKTASRAIQSTFLLPRSSILPLKEDALEWKTKGEQGEEVRFDGKARISILHQGTMEAPLILAPQVIPQTVVCGFDYRLQSDSSYKTIEAKCSADGKMTVSLGQPFATGEYVLRAWAVNPYTKEKLYTEERKFKVITELTNFGLKWVMTGKSTSLPSSTALWASNIVGSSGVYAYSFTKNSSYSCILCSDKYVAAHSTMGLRFGAASTTGDYYNMYMGLPSFEGYYLSGLAITNNDVSYSAALCSDPGPDSVSKLPNGATIASNLVSGNVSFSKSSWAQIETDSEKEPKYLVSKSKTVYLLNVVILYYEK